MLTLLMHGWRVKVAGLCLATGVANAQPTNAPAYRLVSWSDVFDRRVSEIANYAREADAGEWYYAESPHIIIYAHSIREIDQCFAQAEYSFREIARLLDVSETAKKAHLILIHHQWVWDKLTEKGRLRPDGLAFQNGREIFLFADDGLHETRVPHELVHFRLRETYSRLPLWLEEGLAMQYGWTIARSWAELQGVSLTRDLPAIEAPYQLSLDELTAIRDYPDKVFPAQAYYRECEETIRAIIERIGMANVGKFLKQVAGEGRNWREVLEKDFKLGEGGVYFIERRVKARLGQRRTD